MVNSLINLLTDKTAIGSPLGRLIVIVFLFLAAWALSRLSGVVARRVLAWQDRRGQAYTVEQTAEITNVKRRETLVAFIRAAIAYAAFTTAAVLSVAQLLGGIDRLAAIAGASFVLILAGFAAQRLLTDVIA